MKKIFLILFILLFSSTTYSEEWVSPIDKKYSLKSPENFAAFSKARDILNSWSGQREKLKEVNLLLSTILENDDKYAPAYREYGRLYIMDGHINYDNYEKGDLNSAEETILKSIEIEPNYADSYVLLGHLYTNMKRYDDATNALMKAESIGTNIPWLHLNRAEILKKQRKYDEALKYYQYIVETGTSNRKAYLSALSGVTVSYWNLNQYDKANEGYKKQIEYDPENAWTWGNYSDFLLFYYNDVDGAIEKGRKAISIMNYGMGRLTLACSLYTKWAQLLHIPNMEKEADSYFEQAWSLYPHPEKVIRETRKSKYTKITSIELDEWLRTRSDEKRIIGVRSLAKKAGSPIELGTETNKSNFLLYFAIPFVILFLIYIPISFYLKKHAVQKKEE